jgi:acetyltransferase-like isoleucine patch superfamily enzyme
MEHADAAGLTPACSLIRRIIMQRLIKKWRLFWLWRSGRDFKGRQAARLARIGVGRYRRQCDLAEWTPRGFFSPDAEINAELETGDHVYVGDRAVILRSAGDGRVLLGNRVKICNDCSLEIFEGGSITIGEQAAIQRGCVLVSAVQPIVIGRRAQIANYCSFFSYDHGIAPDQEIYLQPLSSKGPIHIGEDAWIGTGVSVLSGVTIGRGAVIGAGSVVVSDIPDNAIAAGVPARVIKYR